MIAAARLLDTNIVSYVMRGGELARAYAPHVRDRLLAISFVTVGELYFGAESARWGTRRRQKLEETLRGFVVVPYDSEVARSYGRLMAAERRAGRSIAPNDAWIAACALRHQVPLVSHNAKHFKDIASLSLITEWRDSSA